MEILAKISEQIKRWEFRSHPNNLWLADNQMKVYIRHSLRLLGERRAKCLDIATVEVRPKLRGKGIFRRFLAEVHALHPYEATFIENVQLPRFREFFRKNNWIEIPMDPEGLYPPNFYKFKEGFDEV